MLAPRIYKFRNRIIKADRSASLRALIVIVLTFFLMALTYLGIYWLLKLITSQPDYLFVPPSMTLRSILTFLFYMLIFTNTITAIGSLYFSSELSLILSAPISGLKFFYNKFIETLVSSSWMTIVFIIPLLLAYGRFYQAKFDYYILSALLLVPYFVLPAAIALVMATISILLIPIGLRKETLLLSVLLFFYGIYQLLNMGISAISPENGLGASDLVSLVQSFSGSRNYFLLPNLIAEVFSHSLMPQANSVTTLILITFFYSTAAISFAYLFLSIFYENCFFRANLIFNVKKARLGNFFSRILERFITGKTFVLVDKEIKVVSRDLTQSVQLLMLLGICALYLYSLSIQSFFIQKSPEQHIKWWRSFFLILNICVESFVITALSSRFAFSAISREGKAFWIMQKAPIKIEQLFKAKFWVWYCFIYLLSALVFGFASWIYFHSFEIVALKVLGLSVINLGLVSLAIGMGGYFARFDWEHISQVATSFGNLVYMILAVLLVMFDVMMEFLFAITNSEPASIVFILALIVVNLVIAKYSLAIGARKLAS